MFLTGVYLQRLILLLVLFISIACTPAPKPAAPPLSSFLAKARPLLAERRYTEAVAILEQAAQVRSQDPVPLIQIGQIYLVQHRWFLAEDAFNRALARDLDNTRAIVGLAETLLDQGRSTEALKWWQKAASINPDHPGVFTGLGRTHLFLFDFEPAQAAFLEQQEHTLDSEAAWYLAALTAPLDLPTALDHLQAIPADESAPGTSSALLARRDYLLNTLAPFTTESSQAEVAKSTGVAMAQLELWPLAIHALNIALEPPLENSAGMVSLTKEDQAEALTFLGYASIQTGQPAFDFFEQAHQLDPNSSLPLYFEGLYLRRQGVLNAAEALFEEAVTLDPQNAALYVEIAQTKVQQGNFSAAEIWYTAAIEVAEDDLPFQLLLLQFYASRSYRMSEAGIPLAKAIIKSHQDKAEAYDMLGWMQFLSGASGSGEQALRQALELEPDLISAHYHLARLLETTGRYPPAQAEYQRVVDGDISGNFRHRALKALVRLEAKF